jgi:hypothetical protein
LQDYILHFLKRQISTEKADGDFKIIMGETIDFHPVKRV